MKPRQLIKKIVPENLKYFLRLENYYNLFFYSFYYLKRSVYELYNRPFKFPLQQTITKISYEHSLPGQANNVQWILRKSGFNVQEGRHCIYLKEEHDLKKILKSIYIKYPFRIGLKVIKSRQISPDKSPYYTSAKIAPASNIVTMRAIGSSLEKIIISNILSLSGCAPRVYDLIYFKSINSWFFGLIVQHIDGDLVSGKEGAFFIDGFRKILKKENIEIVAVKKSKDFKPPHYNNNIIAHSKDSIIYIDIQNFAVLKRGNFHYPNKLLKRFEVISNKKNKNPVKRKEISYINAKKLKRKIYSLNSLTIKYLTEQSFNFKETIIVDFGYPIGLMTCFALSSGASWSYLLDLEDDAKITERYLFENGFSRFEIFNLSNVYNSEKKWNEIDLVIFHWQNDVNIILELARHIYFHNLLLDCHKIDHNLNNINKIDKLLNTIGLSCGNQQFFFKNEIRLKYYSRL